MPVRLSDHRLAALYARFEQQQRAQPSSQLGRDQVLQLLAEAGDRPGATTADLLAQLAAPSLTREQQVALIQRGMTAEEKRDLEAILDDGGLAMEPAARELMSAVVGRAQDGRLRLTGDQRDGLSGLTRPGARIEAINLSAAPTGRLHLDDTVEVGRADARGSFSRAQLTGDQAMREGDLVRLRARFEDGSTSDWLTVKAAGLAPGDTRNAEVALFRIGLADKGNGVVEVSNLNASRQVSEPGARLQFTNTRTGERAVATITETGGFAPGFTVKGRAGDTFSVAATDGVNNTSFAAAVGNVTVPGGSPAQGELLPDPAPHRDERRPDGTSRFALVRFTGPLFVNGVRPEDVQQGQIGNCYFPAAMAAVAKTDPDAIGRLIRDNGDGTYTVTFKERDWSNGTYKDVPVRVDGDLYARPNGAPLYGKSSNSSDPRTMELWFPLVEKAYAQWRGDYDAIGNGGQSQDVLEAVVGKRGAMIGVATVPSLKEDAWAQIKKSVDERTPVVAGTHLGGSDALYTNTGVYGDHGYSVLGYEERGGQRFVVLRNPWGESEPAGNGPNDGVFTLALDDFARLFGSLMYVDDNYVEPVD